MIDERRDKAEEMLNPEQLDFAAEYVRRWRNWHPDDKEIAKGEVIQALRDSTVVRGIAGAALRLRSPFKGKTVMACGKCGMKWPTCEDAWVCYTSGEHRAPINEIR